MEGVSHYVCTQQAFIIPPPYLDHLYHPPRVGWCSWSRTALPLPSFLSEVAFHQLVRME